MSDLRDLYQEVILDHNKRPRNFRELEEPDQRADGHNPLCGDTVTIYLKLDGDQIEDLSFQGSGCAISRASASMMTEALKGKTLDEAQALFDRFHDRVMGKEIDDVKRLGKLDALSGVAEFPMRVKCATLAWHTLHAALVSTGETVTTE